MGADYVTGTDQEPESSFSTCVGWPLSTLRAEAASLLQLLINLRCRSSIPLLVFVDCPFQQIVVWCSVPRESLPLLSHQGPDMQTDS